MNEAHIMVATNGMSGVVLGVGEPKSCFDLLEEALLAGKTCTINLWRGIVPLLKELFGSSWKPLLHGNGMRTFIVVVSHDAEYITIRLERLPTKCHSHLFPCCCLCGDELGAIASRLAPDRDYEPHSCLCYDCWLEKKRGVMAAFFEMESRKSQGITEPTSQAIRVCNFCGDEFDALSDQGGCLFGMDHE